MSPKSILIVEDDGILCANIEKMLKAKGYGVVDALPSGEAALELVKERQPDLIIMDIMLNGELDGISTAQQIHKFADIPVIYLTAYAGETLIQQAIKTGPYAYLVKPVQERELIATIEMALRRHSLEQKLRQTETTLRQSEQFQKNIIDNLHDLVSLTDLAGNFIFVGPSHTILGYNLDSLIGKNVMDYVHPDDIDKVSDLFKKFLQNPDREKNKKVEYRYRCADGSYLWFETVGKLLLDESGNQKEILFNTREITTRKDAEEMLAFQLEREKVISQVSSNFSNLPAEKTDEGISYALNLTGELFNVDRSYLFLLSPDGNEMNNTHEWCKEGVEPQLEFLQNLPLHTFPWWLQKLQRFENIAVQDVNELPPEATAEKKTLQVQSIQSVLVVPLLLENELHGFMGFDTVTEAKAWTGEQISMLKVVAEMISNALLKRQSEQALQESEEKHRRLFETMAQGVIFQAADGTIISANPAAQRILGLSFEQMQGKTSMDPRWQMIKEDGTAVPGTEHPAMIALRTGKKVGPVTRGVFRPDKNAHVWLIITAIPLFQPGETEPFQAYATFEDITERKQAEKEIKEEEAKYRVIFETVSDALLIFSKDSIIVEANPAACRIYNYTRQELVGLSGRDIVHPDYHQLFIKFINDVQQKDYFHTESVDLRRDGSAFDVEVNGTALLFNGEDCLLAIVRDITDRKKAEEALRRREEEFHALAENAPDVVARFDRNLRYLYVNPAVEQYTGIPQESFMGRTSEELKLPVEQTLLRNSKLTAAFQGGREQEMYYDHPTPTGLKYYHSRLVPEFAPDGTVETVLSIARDITDIKEMEAALYQERVKTQQMHRRALPDELPLVPGLALSAGYIPAAPLQGDYYNVIRRHNQLLLYLVDVDNSRDDGVVQSLYVRKMIEDYISAHDDAAVAPAMVLRYLTESFYQEHGDETDSPNILVAVLDMSPEDVKGAGNSLKKTSNPVMLSYATLGFAVPFLLVRDRDDHGKPLPENLYLRSDKGDAPLNYQEQTLTITPGSTLLFSTDGLFKQGPDLGSYELRPRELLKKQAHLPPELISEAVKADVNQFYSDFPLQNDIAFITVQVPAEEQHLNFKLESEITNIGEAKKRISLLLTARLGQEPDLLHFHELLVNAMEHGNKRDGAKALSIDFIITDRYYKAIITDQGEGFNWRSKINKELDLEGDSERGRGIIMTRMMTDYLGYNELGNRVTMIKLLE